MSEKYVETNQQAWNLRTPVHLKSQFYDVAGFRRGKLSLCPPERALVKNVKGSRILHLQCHFGLDTLSWVALGADATGVDFSPIAIGAARQLSKEVGLAATFIEADVQSLGERFERSFDLAISTYGVMCWLHDLVGWARSIRGSLRPGGQFILVEYHPVLDLLYEGKVSGHASYFGSDKTGEAVWTSGTYTNPDAPITYAEYRWQHPISEVVNALSAAGLRLIDFKEYPYCSYKLFPSLDTKQGDVWISSEQRGAAPFMYSLVAEAS